MAMLLDMELTDEILIEVFFFLGIMVSLLIPLVAIVVNKIIGKSMKAPVGYMFVNLILLGGFFLFASSHKTTIRYNDWAVVGHSITDVEEKYGPVDVVKGNNACYYMDGERGYWMHFDSEGIVDRVAYGYGPGG